MIVYKYPLTQPHTGLELPFGAQILTAQMQGNQIVIWALLSEREVRTVRRLIFAVNTGDPFDLSSLNHIATVTSSNGIVWHVFEVLP